MKDRLAWLQAKLQQAYDNGQQEINGTTIDCRVIWQSKGTQIMESKITWTQHSDEDVALGAVIDKAIRNEP